MANQIVHFEIAGKSKEVLESFYTALFDWKIQEAMPGYSLVQPGAGIGGGLGTMGGGASYVTFYVQVESVEATLATAEAHGATKLFGPHVIPDGATIAAFSDPEGHVIGILQPAPGM